MSSPLLTSQSTDETTTIRVAGDLVTGLLGDAEPAFHELRSDRSKVTLDLSGLNSLDTGGALLVLDLQARLAAEGNSVAIVGGTDDQTALLNTVREALPKEEGVEYLPSGLSVWVADLGQKTAQGLYSFVSLLGFFGLTLHRMGCTVVRPWRLRTAALFSQMEETGLNAVPIVVLMSFLIGVVLSFQGAAQLRQFGAEVFVVDLIAISILRELGILLTAIIVAGRSGSAFTASIGSMKVREELDAMRTLGLDPIEVLVLPRVLALVIMLPILGFIANVAGLFGGAMMSWLELGVSPGMFITRMHENTDIWHLAVGMIKAPFFAIVIAVVACWRAMQVQGSSESVGRQTTASVVQAIFLVIAIDALFSIFFESVGV